MRTWVLVTACVLLMALMPILGAQGESKVEACRAGPPPHAFCGLAAVVEGAVMLACSVAALVLLAVLGRRYGKARKAGAKPTRGPRPPNPSGQAPARAAVPPKR